MGSRNPLWWFVFGVILIPAWQGKAQEADSDQSSPSSIVGAPIGETVSDDETSPVPPPDLNPIDSPVERPVQPPVVEPALSPPTEPTSPPLRLAPSPTATRRALPTQIPTPRSGLRERVPISNVAPDFQTESALNRADTGLPRGVRAEYQPAGGVYRPGLPAGSKVHRGERLRWKYPSDTEWRLLEAYDVTMLRLFDHHYEIGGDFFHSFRHENHRVQVPTMDEARKRTAVSQDSQKRQVRLFVEVDSSAPKAPKPVGDCLVWQKDKLLLNGVASGEIETVVAPGKIDHLELASLTRGVIYGLDPPSTISLYAVQVDFEEKVFAELGKEKGQCDSEAAKLAQLLEAANTEARRTWCEARLAYETEKSQVFEERRQWYELFFRGELDSHNLIRGGHPMPHVQLAQTSFRHGNLDLDVGIFSNHQGEVLCPAKALLWINNAVPFSGTPFSFEIVDMSDPDLVGFDTRFASDGSNLVAEERAAGSNDWVAREYVIDTYWYAAFQPPQPDGPPEYLLDVTVDVTEGLKRVGREMMVNGRLGTVQLTPDFLRVDLRPNLLISPIPMDKFLREVLIGPLDLRGWISGRRTRIHQVFDKASILPDAVLDPFEDLADELAMRVHQVEKEKKQRSTSWKFEPANLTMTLSRLPTPGQMSVECVFESTSGELVRVSRVIQPEFDLIDFAASSVAANRMNNEFHQLHRLPLSEWQALKTGAQP